MCNSQVLFKISSAFAKDQYVVQNWTKVFDLLLPSDYGLKMQLEKNFYEMKMSIDSVFNHILTHWTGRTGSQAIPKLIEILEANSYQFVADLIRQIVSDEDGTLKVVQPSQNFVSDKHLSLRNISRISGPLAKDPILELNFDKFVVALFPSGRARGIERQRFTQAEVIQNVLAAWVGRRSSQDSTVSKLVEILLENEFVSAAEIVMEVEPSL